MAHDKRIVNPSSRLNLLTQPTHPLRQIGITRRNLQKLNSQVVLPATEDGSPPSPLYMLVTAMPNNSYVITWNSVYWPTARHYEIWRADDSAGTNATLVGVLKHPLRQDVLLQFTYANDLTGKQYYFSVATVTEAGYQSLGSAWTSSASAAGFNLGAQEAVFSPITWSQAGVTAQWSALVVHYKGIAYNVVSGSTTDMYIWWDVSSPTSLQHGSSLPADSDGIFSVAKNLSGVAHGLSPFATRNVSLLGNLSTVTLGNNGGSIVLAGGEQLNVTSISTGSTLSTSQYVIAADATGGGFTLTLPVMTISNSVGQAYEVVKIDATANAIVLAAGGSDVFLSAPANLAAKGDMWFIRAVANGVWLAKKF